MLRKISILVYYTWKDQQTGILYQERSTNWYIMQGMIRLLVYYDMNDQHSGILC